MVDVDALIQSFEHLISHYIAIAALPRSGDIAKHHCLSVGLVSEAPELTHYWVVEFQPRASAKLTSRLCPLIDY